MGTLRLILVLFFALMGCEDNPSPDTDGRATPSADAGARPAAQLRINEAVCSTQETGDHDWFELVVIGSVPIELADYTIVDSQADRAPAALPDITLSPGEFLVIAATDEAPEDGRPFVPFKLGKTDGLTLRLADSIIDEIAWGEGDAPAGASWGRLPDADGEWSINDPTPGSANRPYSGEAPMETFDPFDGSRVVEVRIELEAEHWQAIVDDPLAEAYQPANIVYGETRVDDVAVRVKGNSSLNSVVRSNSERFSFKVDINRFNAEQTLFGEKKFNFNNGFKDPTLIREHLAYQLIHAAGAPASRTGFVDLWVADQHMGLYTVVEQIDGSFLDDHFDDGHGDLYKPEPPAGSLQYRGPNISNYANHGIKTNEDTTDHSAFLELVETLDRGSEEALDAILDLDAALLNLAINSVLVNLDSYMAMGHNYYLYHQAGGFTVLPWDLNEAFGNFTCGCDRDGLIHFLIDEPTCGPLNQRALVARLVGTPELREIYHGHLEVLIDGPFSAETMNAQIDSTADVIREYVYADETKFFSNADFERNLTDDLNQGRRGGALGLKAFVRDRIESIRQQLNGERASTAGGLGNCDGGPSNPGGPATPGGPGGGGDCSRHPCGDGTCDNFEQMNPNVCPRDCGAEPEGGDWCGDGNCDAREGCERSCPADCQ